MESLAKLSKVMEPDPQTVPSNDQILLNQQFSSREEGLQDYMDVMDIGEAERSYLVARLKSQEDYDRGIQAAVVSTWRAWS